MTYTCSECILDMLASSGPQTRADLRIECKTQAVPFGEWLFNVALDQLVKEGKIVLEPEDEPYYDFPDSYYLPPLKEV
jgi:hypothetical protein